MEEIVTKVNTVYYQDTNDNLKEHTIYYNKKLKMSEVRNILTEKGIGFNKIIKVLLEDISISIHASQLRMFDHKTLN